MDTSGEVKKFKKINLFITGYGPFMKVTENPSQMLVESIFCDSEQFDEKFNKKIELKFNEILNVDVDYVCKNITQCYDSVATCSDCEMNLIVHFGVYPGGSGVLLEKQCKNYINDYKSHCSVISLDCADQLTCKLDLESVCQSLKCQGLAVNTSTDAGTYLCNYVYFLSSLHYKECQNTFPVFIHIPPLNEMKTDECKNVVFNFLKEMELKYT
jgi:pyrrolidone-carboxylate peptidase